MQLLDFALLGLAVAAPTAHQDPQVDNPAVSQPEQTTCPELNNAHVVSEIAQQPYKLQCSQWNDAPPSQLIKIVTTTTGYKGCLAACDAEPECAVSEYIATDDEQVNGSCTLYRAGGTIKQGNSNSWTLAIKTGPPHAIPAEGDKFKLHTTIYNGTELVSVTGVKASNSRLFVGGGASNASCDAPVADDLATFTISNGSAYLYAASATPQQLWVDQSGMGQGLSGYTTGVQNAPRYASRQNFTIDAASGFLTFSGSPAIACPPEAGDAETGWSLWFTVSKAPGWNEGCLPVALRAVAVENPVGCYYTPATW